MNWKKIEAFPRYSISDTGSVRNDETGKVLRPAKDSNGYSFVILHLNNKKIHGYLHRLVATAFIPNPLNLPEVNHKDLNKSNNDVSNLEWVTRRENIIHRYKTLGHNNRGRTSVICVETDITYKSVAEAAKAVHVSEAMIWKCLTGKSHTAGGFHWKVSL